MIDSILINTPISSPLHPQLNLPLLKGHLSENGFRTKIIDGNIQFFHQILGPIDINKNLIPRLEEPLNDLGSYNDLEKQWREKCRAYDGLYVGLRSLSMKYDRTQFNSVIDSLEDRAANPFIEFFEKLIMDQVLIDKPKIVGIGITFQDQILTAFTLANLLRKTNTHRHLKLDSSGILLTVAISTKRCAVPSLKTCYSR